MNYIVHLYLHAKKVTKLIYHLRMVQNVTAQPTKELVFDYYLQ